MILRSPTVDEGILCPLVGFQKLMWRWRDLHPYNVVDAVLLPRSIDPTGLARAADDFLDEIGMSKVDVLSGGKRYRLSPGSAQTFVRQESQIVSDRQWFERHATREHALPFEANGRFPWRFTIQPTHAGCWVAMTYDHWIMDGFAGSLLFLELLSRYVLQRRWSDALHRSGPSLREVVPSELGWRRQLPRLMRSIADLRQMKRTHSPSRGPLDDLAVDIRVIDVPTTALDHLRSAASQTGGTINDVLIAYLADAIDQATRSRLHENRNRLAVSCVVDLRPLAPEALSRAIGNYLAHFPVVLPEPRPRNFGDRVRQVTDITRRVKQSRSYLGSAWECAYSNLLWPWLSNVERVRLFRNNNPIGGGISNLRLPDDWTKFGKGHFIMEYLRAVPAGPATPLALGVTTAAERLTLTLTARRNGYSPEQCQRIADHLRLALRGIA